jgi:DinB family protein
MHPRTEELLNHLEENRAALHAAVDAVPSSLRETRPATDRWSVAEVLEHLGRVEEQLTRLLAAKLAEARLTGALGPERESGPIADSFGDLLLDRRRRIAAGDRVLPRAEMDATTALATLDKTRATLRDLVVSHDGLNLGAVSHPHPATQNSWARSANSSSQQHAAVARSTRLTSQQLTRMEPSREM